jgi:RimJ/RimL family protein N-acetyltransferase
MQVFLETQRLMLRRFTMADAGDLVSLDADPDVMRFVTGGVPTSRDEIENEVLPAFLGYYQRYEGFGFWAAVEKTTGEFLGWFHFRPRGDAAPGEVELGYRLRKSAWGKGYATEGSCALICKGFTEFGVRRVVAEAMAVNTASRRVMEKAGLKLVRTFYQPWPYPIEGDQFGDVEYALDKADWQQDQPGASGMRLLCTGAPAVTATVRPPFQLSTAEQRENPARCCSHSTWMANGSPFAELETAAPPTTG